MVRSLKAFFTNGFFLAGAAVTLTAILVHGLGIPRLGYYHDDWYMLWSAASRGTDSLISLFSTDRPFMGVIYTVYYRIIGQNIAGWHLFALLWRIAGGLAFYWILQLAFPKIKNLHVLSAMLFVVFPGFLSEPNAATKINHLTGFGSALLSIALTLQSIKANRNTWKIICTILSMLLMALYLWIYEYMIGLEVMRVVLMVWTWWQDGLRKPLPLFKKIVIWYIPYLLVAAVFMYWRVFVFESTRNAMDMRGLLESYRSDPLNMAVQLITQVFKDFLSAAIFAWGIKPHQLVSDATSSGLAAALGAAAVIVLLAVGYTLAARKTEIPQTDGEKSTAPILAITGALIALAAVFPVVMSDRHLDLLDAYKSYGLHPSPGAILLALGFVAMLKPAFRKPLLITLLALSVVTQSLNIQHWGRYWDVQKSLWWQMTWRAPDLQDSTLVIAYTPEGYGLREDYEMFGPINLIYRPYPLSVPAIQTEVLNQDTMRLIIEGKYDGRYVRDIHLAREFGNFLMVSQPTTRSCMHIIDGEMPIYSAYERPIVKLVGEYSRIDQIITTAAGATPPEAVFGSEPEHNWCYYFQKASLARQSGDWQTIADLYDAAASTGDGANDSVEYFVFIEGLVNSGREDTAQRIVENSIKENLPLKQSLCKSLEAAPDYPEAYGYRIEAIEQIICE